MTATIPKPSPPRRVNCPHPEKKSFTTYDLSEAERNHQVELMVERGWTTHFPIRSYKCSCNFWHWTSKPPGKRAVLAEVAAGK